MKLNRILILIILLLVSSSVLAEEHQLDPFKFDTNNPQNFDYLNGDYSTVDFTNADINWNNVVWSKIPLNKIADIPKEKIVISKLDEAQLEHITSDQLAFGDNLEEIEDLSLYVDESVAIEAIKKSKGVDIISLGFGAKIEKGILISDKGQFDFSGRKELENSINEMIAEIERYK